MPAGKAAATHLSVCGGLVIAEIVPMLTGDFQPSLSQYTVLGIMALKAILICQLIARIINLKRRPEPAEKQTTLPQRAIAFSLPCNIHPQQGGLGG